METKENQNNEAFVVEHNLRSIKVKMIEACKTLMAAREIVGEDCWGEANDTIDRLLRELDGEQEEKECGADAETDEYMLGKLNKDLNAYSPKYQRHILNKMLATLPEKIQEQETEEKRNDAIEELLGDVVSDLSTETIIAFTKRCKNNGALVSA